MIWRAGFVGLLLLSLLTACGDRERVNCPPNLYIKNKAIRSTLETTSITIDTASVGSAKTIENRCL